MKNRIPLRTGPLLWIVPCLAVGAGCLLLLSGYFRSIGDRAASYLCADAFLWLAALTVLLPIGCALLNQVVYMGTIRALRHFEAERAAPQPPPTSATSTP